MTKIKWTGKEFKVVKQLLDKRIFEEWIAEDGRLVLEETLGRIRARWFFGSHRAKRKLRRAARSVLKPKMAFANTLKRKLDEFPELTRKIGIRIKQRGYKDLYAADGDGMMALVVVPRAVARNEFTLFLIEKLATSSSLVAFRGLARRIAKHAATEAEERFYEKTRKGGTFPYPSGKAMVLSVEPDFDWHFGGLGGHYYCAYSGKDGLDLKKWGERRKFKSEMEAILEAQRTHLKRLKAEEIAVIADTLRGKTNPNQPVVPVVTMR